MKRIIVTTIPVLNRGQKINFEIRLPQNAKKITGVQFTFSAINEPAPPTSSGGGSEPGSGSGSGGSGSGSGGGTTPHWGV